MTDREQFRRLLELVRALPRESRLMFLRDITSTVARVMSLADLRSWRTEVFKSSMSPRSDREAGTEILQVLDGAIALREMGITKQP